MHRSAEGSALLDIAFEGADGIEGVTPNHPFWSVDRQEFVRAEELVEGEQVDTANGRAAVAHVAWRRAGPETLLYNLETLAEQCVPCGAGWVLVHNAGQPYITPESNGPYEAGVTAICPVAKTRGTSWISHHMPDQHAKSRC